MSTREVAADAPAFLRLRGVTKCFGKATVLQGIDLDIGREEFICLLGPSGCGKTTLLRILAGIEQADDGTLELNAQDITQCPAEQRRFGMVFQSYALFPNLSAVDNVAYGLIGVAKEARQRRALEMLEMVGLVGLAGRYPAQLSGGQQQRVALARALAPQPRLLLLDEPLSALDAQVRLGLRHEIRQLQRRLRMPVVLVTHDQDEALTMADRVVLMRDGRIEQQHDPIGLYARPDSEFAARFMGRINLWPAQVLGANIVQVGRQTINVAGDRALHQGNDVTVGIRPEHVSLRASNANADQAQGLAEDHFPGIVQHSMFCGPHVSVTIRLPTFAATVDVTYASPSDGHLPWAEGDACSVHLPPQAMMVFAANDLQADAR
jgi:iron(III) transport system ATP-binding protein